MMLSKTNQPKRYFSITEVGKLCDLKPHVLRYWEKEFPQLRPLKRCGNRRYYQQEDILMVQRIQSLLYQQGFTIEGARAQLAHAAIQPLSESQESIKAMIHQLEVLLTKLVVE